MTKLEAIKNLINLELLKTTSIFNIHNVDVSSVGLNKNSNLHKSLKSIEWIGDSNKGDDMVTVFVGAKGRSQHSRTELHIFKGVLPTDHDLYHGSYEFKLSRLV